MTVSTPTRLRIVGVSGSGKSHAARRAASALGLPLLELDAVFWAEDWTHRDVDEARDLVRAFVAAHPEGWIVEGNWSSKLDGLLDPGTPGGADAFVWLDHPRALVLGRVVARTVRRGIRREELWHGNRERLSSLLKWHPEKNIVRWSWTNHPVITARMMQRMADGVPVVRLRGQRAVDAWIEGLSERHDAAGRRSVEG